jgi:hypothetical protein
MSGKIRQISYASSEEDDESNYSQDGLDHSDNSTIRDTENPPAATSDELGALETTSEEEQSLSDDDDSSVEDDLPTMLMNLKDKIAKELVCAINRARSTESQHPEPSNDAESSDLETKLAEMERSRDYEIDRAGLYKVRVKELTKINESLVKEKNDLTTKVNTLTAEIKAARAKVMEIFG